MEVQAIRNIVMQEKFPFFRKTNWRFSEALERLERESCVFGLTLQSFLVLPMQRVTRYPLLVDVSVGRYLPFYVSNVRHIAVFVRDELSDCWWHVVSTYVYHPGASCSKLD